MADKYSLRKYLMFQALIQRLKNPTRAVDRYIRQHPDLDDTKTKSWEAWKEDFVPDFGARKIETATLTGNNL